MVSLQTVLVNRGVDARYSYVYSKETLDHLEDVVACH